MAGLDASTASWVYRTIIGVLMGMLSGLFLGSSNLSPAIVRVNNMEQRQQEILERVNVNMDRIRVIELTIKGAHPEARFLRKDNTPIE